MEPWDNAGDITKKVKVLQNSMKELTLFPLSTGLLPRKNTFNWYNILEDIKLHFAKIKLVSFAKLCWYGIGKNLTGMRKVIETWDDMEVMLAEKYLPPNYFEKVCDQACTLIKMIICIIKYVQKFLELKMNWWKMLAQYHLKQGMCEG